MNNPVLSAQGINKVFKSPEPFAVLQDINLSIQKGEFLTLIGKSGCGKSTLMYILSTLDSDYSGSLQIAGTDLKDKTKNQLAAFRNKHIGFVFQFHYLLPEFTVMENLMIPARKMGVLSTEEIESRAMDKLTLLGIADQARKLSSRLSGGQQQRVAIARALMNDPDIIMGDEPTGNLDSYNSGLVLEMFRELTRVKGQTLIAVTHDLDFAKASDRIVEMQDGKIISV
jgi:lipoprotein-releasing system ATP-binding protein